MGNIARITVNNTDYDIKDAFSRERLSWYGSSSSLSNATTKLVTCSGFTLDTGRTIAVKFANANTASPSSLKLNVNDTGDKAIKYKGGNLPKAELIEQNSVIYFVYDGTNYEIVGGIGGGTGTVDSVNGKIGTVVLDSTDVGAVASDQGVGNAGKFLVVNASGIVEPVQMSTWSGGVY